MVQLPTQRSATAKTPETTKGSPPVEPSPAQAPVPGTNADFPPRIFDQPNATVDELEEPD